MSDIANAQQRAQAAMNVGYTAPDAANVFTQPQEIKWKLINGSTALLNDPKLRSQMSGEFDAASEKFQKLYQQYSRDGGEWALENSGLTPTIQKWTQLVPTLDAEANASTKNDAVKTDAIDQQAAYKKYLQSSLQKALSDTKSTPEQRAQNVAAVQGAIAQFENTGKMPNFTRQAYVESNRAPDVSTLSQLGPNWNESLKHVPIVSWFFNKEPDKISYPPIAMPPVVPNQSQSNSSVTEPLSGSATPAIRPMIYISGHPEMSNDFSGSVLPETHQGYSSKDQVQEDFRKGIISRSLAKKILQSQF